MKNILNINKGRIMAAFDIHGNWEDYQAIRKKFNEMKQEKKADILLWGGDLIHAREDYPDKSIEILDDLIKHPKDITLLGNHEIMHIYHLDVHKNSEYFASGLEEKMKPRDKYIDFMKTMPFAVKTAGGVLINHAGAFPSENELYKKLNNLNHDKIIKTVKKELKQYNLEQYGFNLPRKAFKEFFPIIGNRLLSTEAGQLIWNAFFSKNEHEFNKEYSIILNDFLKKMSTAKKPLKFLVSGHIKEPEGHKVIENKQLRISSSYGAEPDKKTAAIIDAGRKYDSINEIELKRVG